MTNQNLINAKKKAVSESQKKLSFPGYPVYAAEQDIYVQNIEEADIDPEDIHKSKHVNSIPVTGSDPLYMEPVSGSDLDIPGAELDDDAESIGNEDEENNYYSLGGDNHTDLDESLTDKK
jgi:hypothetical protein